MLTTPTSPYDPTTVMMVGDRMDTDGSFAIELGCRFALVRTGSTPPGAGVDGLPVDALDVADLGAVASALLGGDD
jgi:ribonucleotide monophosphatase NagD (HAD superfamily)